MPNSKPHPVQVIGWVVCRKEAPKKFTPNGNAIGRGDCIWDAINKLAQSPKARIDLDLQITNKYDILVKRD